MLKTMKKVLFRQSSLINESGDESSLEKWRQKVYSFFGLSARREIRLDEWPRGWK